MTDNDSWMDGYREATTRFRTGFSGGLAEECLAGLRAGDESLASFGAICRQAERDLGSVRRQMEGWKGWGEEDFERELAELDRQLGLAGPENGKQAGKMEGGYPPSAVFPPPLPSGGAAGIPKESPPSDRSTPSPMKRTPVPPPPASIPIPAPGPVAAFGDLLRALRACDGEKRRGIPGGDIATSPGAEPAETEEERLGTVAKEHLSGIDTLKDIAKILEKCLKCARAEGTSPFAWTKEWDKKLLACQARLDALRTKAADLSKRASAARERLAVAHARAEGSPPPPPPIPTATASWPLAVARARELEALLPSPDRWNERCVFPDWVRTETFETATGESFPMGFAFPLERPVRFADAAELDVFLLHLMQVCPLGFFEAYLLDHEALGRHGVPFNAFRTAGIDVFRLATTPEAELAALRELVEYCGELARNGILSGGAGTWADCNARSGLAPLPYKVVAIHSFRGWDERHFDALESIVAEGCGRGVGILWAASSARGLEARPLERIQRWGSTMVPAGPAELGFDPALLGLSHRPERLPSPERMADIAAGYSEALLRRNASSAKGFMDLFAGQTPWSNNSGPSLEAVIGWDERGTPIWFRLGIDERQHALVGGATSSGKSNFLHVLVCSLCHAYSPEELRVVWLDMKDGVEVSRYLDGHSRQAWLPHARAILATHAPSAALELLQRIETERLHRNELFRNAGVVGISEWRARTGTPMPRILLVADEFTRMFDGADTANAIARVLTNLLAYGRSSGIHVVLATQNTDQIRVSQAAVMLSQLRVRVAFPGAGGDVLGTGNNDSDTLHVPQGILNESGGAPGKNAVFVHPPFSKEEGNVEAVRKMFEALHRERGGGGNCLVVDQFGVLSVPDPAEFRRRTAAHRTKEPSGVELWLGRQAHLDGAPFSVTLRPDAPRDHLMVSGTDTAVLKGLSTAVLRSLLAAPDTRALVYAPQGETPPPELSASSSPIEWIGKSTGEDELRKRLDALRNSEIPNRVLVIQDYQQAPLLFRNVPDYEKVDTDRAFALFEEAFAPRRKAFSVVAFTLDPTASAGTEYGMGEKRWEAFAHRIGFALAPDALRVAVPGADRIEEPGGRCFHRGIGPLVEEFLPFVYPAGERPPR